MRSEWQTGSMMTLILTNHSVVLAIIPDVMEASDFLTCYQPANIPSIILTQHPACVVKTSVRKLSGTGQETHCLIKLLSAENMPTHI